MKVDYRDYKKLREEGKRSNSAFSILKNKPIVEARLDKLRDHCTKFHLAEKGNEILIDGFRIVAKVDFDEFADVSYCCGCFTDKPSENTIEITKSLKRRLGLSWSYYDDRDRKYYEHPYSVESAIKAHSKLGKNKHDAYLAAMREVYENIEHLNDDFDRNYPYCLSMSVYRKNICVADYCVGGIYFKDMYELDWLIAEDNIIEGLLDEAKDTLKELCCENTH